VSKKKTDTEEEAFQQKLDEHPEDHATRLVLADWLQEHNDARAEGYRALARCGFVLSDRYSGPPIRYIPKQASRIFRRDSTGTGSDYTFPPDWYEKLPGAKADESGGCVLFPNRREAEDAAALAFAALPKARRDELLAGERGEG
jgi:uncharacterized protein (TIGR02996 family)